MMQKFAKTGVTALVLSLAVSPASARELATVTRVNASSVKLTREDTTPVNVWISADTKLDQGDQRFAADKKDREITLPIAASVRRYVILEDNKGQLTVLAERVVPLEQASNFRDIGGYVTKSGKSVKWDRAFRSGAMPLFTEADYALAGQLNIGTVVDLRSMDERQVTPDMLDDRIGALFISNDYGMKALMKGFTEGDKENPYSGMEKVLAPQYRSMFRQLIANEGAVLYHCSAGQDRTGILTALLYDVLGVDRETIVTDYHLSTELRRTQFEMPNIDPQDYPGNFLVQHYMAGRTNGQQTKAEPLFTPKGASQLAQFFVYLDKEYGGSEGYLKTVLGFNDADIEKLRATMLQ